jgi:D-tyrosyl-tRNA(Tyr) deacylase
MRLVVQRVRNASVDVQGKRAGEIGIGFVVLAGVARDDTEADVDFLAEKVAHLRVFEDEQRKMNRSILEIGGALLVISQFTLLADCRKGRRPSFINAAPPEMAERYIDRFVNRLKEYSLRVETGIFQAMMDVSLCNYGPVTIVLDSKELLEGKGEKAK